MSEVAAAIDRAHELPGRIEDARHLRARLLLRTAEIERKIRALDREAATAREGGGEFLARRLRVQARALEEERLDAQAMLEEVERVLQRLRRERRSLLYRLECGEALAASFPSASGKAVLFEMLDEARRVLDTRRLAASAAMDA